VLMSALAEHVLSVVFGGSQEQVIRTHAGWVVAVVQDPQAIRDRAKVKLVRDAVCQEMRPLRFTDSDLPVAPFAANSSPDPTDTGLVYVCPEAFCERLGLSRVFTLTAAILAGIGRLPLEGLRAVLTGAIYKRHSFS
jgi:hypothetical protein